MEEGIKDELEANEGPEIPTILELNLIELEYVEISLHVIRSTRFQDN